MRQLASSPIPRVTADLITASAAFAALTSREALKQRCAVVEAIARQGRNVDDLTVGELLAITLEARRCVG